MPQQLLLHPSVDKFGVGPLTQNATTCQMIVITGTECYPKGPKHPKKKNLEMVEWDTIHPVYEWWMASWRPYSGAKNIFKNLKADLTSVS